MRVAWPKQIQGLHKSPSEHGFHRGAPGGSPSNETDAKSRAKSGPEKKPGILIEGDAISSERISLLRKELQDKHKKTARSKAAAAPRSAQLTQKLETATPKAGKKATNPLTSHKFVGVSCSRMD